MKECAICGGLAARVVERCADGVELRECGGCGVRFLEPFPKVDAAAHYDEAYYRPWIDEQAEIRRRLWKGRLAAVARHKAGGRLLDLGCGNGDFLREAKEAGWEVRGTEVSAWACSYIKEKYGVEVGCGDALSLDLPREHFDAVTMWHVLEHLPDPVGNLRKVRGLLKPDGILWVAVPNARNYLTKAAYRLVKGRPLRFYTPGERELHLFDFTPRALGLALEKAGFKVLTSGLDRNALRWQEKAIETAAYALYRGLGVNVGDAMEFVAGRAA